MTLIHRKTSFLIIILNVCMARQIYICVMWEKEEKKRKKCTLQSFGGKRNTESLSSQCKKEKLINPWQLLFYCGLYSSGIKPSMSPYIYLIENARAYLERKLTSYYLAGKSRSIRERGEQKFDQCKRKKSVNKQKNNVYFYWYIPIQRFRYLINGLLLVFFINETGNNLQAIESDREST